MSRTAYLFDPVRVGRLLGRLPDLRRVLRDPTREGVPSVAFPHARKSERQVYRILGNPQYGHLGALLQSLDYCLARGFTQPAILKSRARGTLASALAELGAAEHFLLHGFEVEGLDLQKRGDPVPEFIARREGMVVAVEVYRPVEWEGLSALPDELAEVLKNLDVRLDYSFEVRVGEAERFDETGGLRMIHPAAVAAALTSTRRARIIGEVIDRILTDLRPGAEARSETVLSDLNLRVSVSLTDVTSSAGELPARKGFISPLPSAGYAPEAMFEHLVVGRVRHKASRAQARGSVALAALIVDLSGTEMAHELTSPVYLKAFVRILSREFGEAIPGYDVLALCEVGDWGRGLSVHVVHHDDHVSASLVRSMFGQHLTDPPATTARR